ncbi:MAG: hypothetical protein LBS58_03740 [Coriobacteriales bacterium]|jgi:nitrogenase molybdenum-iron protein alpha chain|nr:hypothetical protein [Coriobacteriales bacterium]
MAIQEILSTSTYSGVRETRPNTFLHKGGDSCDMAGTFKRCQFKEADRSFSQGQQCAQINSVAALFSLEDSVFVVHSPLGCTGCLNFANELYRVGQAHRKVSTVRNGRMIVTNLDEESVVLGGEGKLREALALAVERHHPKLVFIIASCASAIIGDDIDAIAKELQQSLVAEAAAGGAGAASSAAPHPVPLIIPVHCEGFKSNIPATGFDVAFIAIEKYILKGEHLPTQEGLINLFAPVSISYKDQCEMERMLEDLGLTTNYIPFYSSLEKIQRIPAAQASTAICKVFADEFMKQVEQRYGVPYAHTVMPIGARNTAKWLRGIAALVGKEAQAEEYIEREYQRVLPRIEAVRKRLEGKRVFICGGTGRSFAAAALVDDFGMKLVGFETPVYDDDAQEDLEYLNSVHGDFVVDVANMQPYEQVNLVRRLKPDVFVGVPVWSARLGIPTTHVLDSKRPTMGYDGLLYLGEKMADQIENPGFNAKLSRYARLPYKESWYNTDPFKFIKEV